MFHLFERELWGFWSSIANLIQGRGLLSQIPVFPFCKIPQQAELRDHTGKVSITVIKSEFLKAERVSFSTADVKKSLRFSSFFLWQESLSWHADRLAPTYWWGYSSVLLETYCLGVQCSVGKPSPDSFADSYSSLCIYHRFESCRLEASHPFANGPLFQESF